jgi:transcription factor TFIIIB component B''
LEYYNKQLEQVRIDHEKNLSQIEEEKQKAAREDAEASRKREIEIRTGIKPMSRAEKLRELRKNEMVVGSIDDMKKQKLEEEA